MMESFIVATTPVLHFGTGGISALPAIAKSFGSRILLVVGAQSFISSDHGMRLLEQFSSLGLTVTQHTIDSEPTPTMVDDAVDRSSHLVPDVLVAIGGGSVLDAGKAISAMLPMNESVKNYLEGVGAKASHPGRKVPFIAIPTTSGTGSEATKNAVLSEIGDKGYKKSLRHNNFVPNIAIVDPALTLSCPKVITAASGMDAFTQLLESYLSTAANPLTDTLACEGLSRIHPSLLNAYQEGSSLEARTSMALASYLSGITLANAGLGLVHGFASSIGGFYKIPHGIICSSLMAAANKVTVRKLRHQGDADGVLIKYAKIGKMFSDIEGKSNAYYTDSLLSLIKNWAAEMKIPGLSTYGVVSSNFKRIANATGNKNNPVFLEKDEMIEVLEMTG